MLVLTRRLGETIVIGNEIRITVVNVGPGRVKLGIQAPANVRIDREEIHERIVEEQAAAPATAAHEEDPIVVGEVEEAPKLHNRIADKLPAETATSNVMKVGHLERFRRKPR